MTAEFRVDLDALSANLRTIRSRLDGPDLMLVVKDDAYGHGIRPVVARAWRDGVRWFGAFDVRTAADVRDVAGPDARIFAWLAGSRSEVSRAIDLDLDLGVGDRALLEEVAALSPRGQRIHLKVDTGLHRNGVRPEEWASFVARAVELERAGTIKVVGVWSHLAEASDGEDDEARRIFLAAVDTAVSVGLTPRVRHLAASAAAFARPEFGYDLVRIGAFAYGIRSAGGPSHFDLGLTPVGTLYATVAAVDVDGVGLDVGSLDGVLSSLAGRFDVATPAGPRRVRRIEPHRTIVESWPAVVGDDVAILGRTMASATDVAEAIGTIGEEITVRLSRRLPRRYAGE